MKEECDCCHIIIDSDKGEYYGDEHNAFIFLCNECNKDSPCKYKGFGDIVCPIYKNPKDDCWYNPDYRCIHTECLPYNEELDGLKTDETIVFKGIKAIYKLIKKVI